MWAAIRILIFGTTSSASGGGGAVGPRLDFSVATNSQYIAVVF